MSPPSVAAAKSQVRERVWSALEAGRAVPDGDAHGRIPDFEGAAAAADRLARTDAWLAANVVKVVPDRPQLPVRERALREGKVVYLAVPRLAAERPFLVLDPTKLPVSPAQAAERAIAMEVGQLVDTTEMPRVDLVVLGSVAVNASGQRLGKGAGYGDLELALLGQAGVIDESTVVATTVHDLQLVEGPLPESAHDGRVDLVVTPTRIVVCPPRPRPAAVRWEDLSEEQIAAIPVLGRLRPRR